MMVQMPDEASRDGSGAVAPPARNTAPGTSGDLPAGYTVGEYKIEMVIGRGGMGVVYVATQPVIEKRVAIKVLNAQYSGEPALVRRFIDEARAVNRIRHANIIDIFSFGQLPDGRHYFVMEYLVGDTLAERLERNDLRLEEVPIFLAQICDALDAAHAESIVHRDLKPENIWIVTPRRGASFVKLLDFGIAKLLAADNQSVTQTGVLMGTPHFMSPEQCHGRGIDHRTDIYAMGVLLYRLYTGEMPFKGETFTEVLAKQLTMMPDPPSRLAQVPPALSDLIMRCLAKDPADRPQSARELGDALLGIFGMVTTPLATGTQSGSSSPSTTLRGSAAELKAQEEQAAGRGLRWLLVTGAVVLLLVGLVAATRLTGRKEQSRTAAAPAPSAAPTATATPPAAPALPAAGSALAPSPETHPAPGAASSKLVDQNDKVDPSKLDQRPKENSPKSRAKSAHS
ncbi:MAG TPA: serine/threonine-protein kinase, partial [Polyangia bacterium]